MFCVKAQLNTSYYKSFSVPSFKGYDARPLKGVIVTLNDGMDSFSVVNDLKKIGDKDAFKVFYAVEKGKLLSDIKKIKNLFEEKIQAALYKWAQDEVILAPNKTVHSDRNSGLANKIAGLTKSKLQLTESSQSRFEGGNLFFVKKDGKEELFIGKNDFLGHTIDDLKQKFGVEKIHVVPQADYHLDLFMRPLKDGKILICDDSMTIKALNKAIKSIQKYIETNNCSKTEKNELLAVKEKLQTLLKEFKKDVKLNHNFSADNQEKFFKSIGYEPIRVPSRIYTTIPNSPCDDLSHSLNYINAIVHEKADGDLVFITGKSALDEECGITKKISEKIGFDFEKMFVDAVSPYIKKENIKFISGDNNYLANLLKKEEGGLHCLCNEIPEEFFI